MRRTHPHPCPSTSQGFRRGKALGQAGPAATAVLKLQCFRLEAFTLGNGKSQRASAEVSAHRELL